jgi:hypothetical protein
MENELQDRFAKMEPKLQTNLGRTKPSTKDYGGEEGLQDGGEWRKRV